MDPQAVKNALITVLKRVQERRGLLCPPLKGHTVPAKELEKFTAKFGRPQLLGWPEK
jgi:hypothetical protein